MSMQGTQILLSISASTTEQENIRGCLMPRYNIIFLKKIKEAYSVLRTRLIPSLVLIDSEGMQEDVMDLFMYLKSKTALENVPVIFLVGKRSSKEAYFLSQGATDVISKPYTQKVLRGRIDKALKDQLLSNYLISKVYSFRDSLEEEHNKLVTYTKQIVSALSSAIDAKDTYTKGHSLRVASYSCDIAKSLGLSDEMVEIIQQAALLHDIGKIGVSDTVLRKPGELNEAELMAIKNHPEIGYQILSSISEIPLISHGAKWHHERYDGKGYPDGLKGEEIPLIARIICVADSFDAMTSDRSYRKPLTAEEARDELIRCKGTQFDPYIVDMAVKIINKKMASKKIYDSAKGIRFTSSFKDTSEQYA